MTDQLTALNDSMTLEARLNRLEMVILCKQPLRFMVKTGAFVPKKSDPESVGWDVKTPVSFSIAPGEVKRVGLGIAWEPPYAVHAIMKERSGLASKGIEIHGGVIDSSYRGEWMVVMTNSGDDSVTFGIGDKIAQFILLRELPGEVMVVSQLKATVRGDGGFGSTGK